MKHFQAIIALSAMIWFDGCQAVLAQNVPGVASQFPQPLIAEAPPSGQVGGFIPTDVTPFGLTPPAGLFNPEMKYRLFQKLPERLWFNSTTEVTQRYESNVFFTSSHPRRDYVYRTLPNLTLGYNVLKNTSIYCNYFVIKDLFANHGHSLSFPTTQSLALGFRQDVTIGKKTSAQFDFQARELWQTAHLRQADLIPSINLTYVLNPKVILFGSSLLQMRSKEYFQGATRELDPFFTLGGVYRAGLWNFLLNDTLVMNWRSPPFHHSIPLQSNMSMIADAEVSRPVLKRMPALQAFVRVEPIWNWDSHRTPGLSGFDVRVFGGLRLSLNKPSYAASIEKLREQLLESERPGKLEPLSLNDALPVVQGDASPSIASDVIGQAPPTLGTIHGVSLTAD